MLFLSVKLWILEYLREIFFVRFYFLYTNDIFLSTNIRLSLFADDTLSYKNCVSDYLKVIKNMELRKVDEWLRKNRLFINYSKTKLLLFNKTAKKSENIVKEIVLWFSRV